MTIVARIRARVPADFVVGLRITANDYMPDGHGVQRFADIARQVEAAGLDYVALSCGCYQTIARCVRDDLCMRRMVFGLPVRCEVNSGTGRESRHGALPPFERMLKAPLESTILALTGSPAFMKAGGAIVPQPKSN